MVTISHATTRRSSVGRSWSRLLCALLLAVCLEYAMTENVTKPSPAPKLVLQTAMDPRQLPETVAKFIRTVKWRHRATIAAATARRKHRAKAAAAIRERGAAKPTYAPLQGILSLTRRARLPVSKLCPTGQCCYSNSKPIVVSSGSTIQISGKGVERDTPPGEEERISSNCIIFGHGNTQLIQVAAGGSVEIVMVTLSHGRAAYGAAAHVDGMLITRQSIFAWNVANHAGAAMYVARPHGHFRGYGTRFIGNTARDEEGDIHVDKGARVECYACHYQKRERVGDVHLEPGEQQHSGLSFRSHEDGVAAAPFGDKVEL